MKKLTVIIGLWLGLNPIAAHAADEASPYGRWEKGPPGSADFFPLAVWLQSPAKAQAYRAAGINTYVALWRGPTAEQLATLRAADMKVICSQNAVGLRHLDDPAIIGWMHGDEPDNAQSLGQGKGYGPPIPPEKIVADYENIRAADPRRPVMLNLGQGVAWDRWRGRGVRTNHPDDYPEYIKGGDIVSFDIYPAAHDSPEVAGKLDFVARGVERLVKWGTGRKVIWNCIECTRISNPTRKATPAQVRAEVWMSLIHGSQGIIYFVHEWQPTFNESALLSDPEMLAAVTAINRQITRLAPVLNGPPLADRVQVTSTNTAVPLAIMVKGQPGRLYVFAVGMQEGATQATFNLAEPGRNGTVEVIDESRTIDLKASRFEDRFQPWEVHLYQLKLDPTPARN
jgi:hypothetical protein